MTGEPKTEKTVEIKEFFEKIPPGTSMRVSGVPREYQGYGPPPPLMYAPPRVLKLPDIELYCPTETGCEGIRSFRAVNEFTLSPGEVKNAFIMYLCKNCEQTIKEYAISGNFPDKETHPTLYKYGERPSFGPPLPSKLIELIRPEWDYFLKGRRTENQGLGIGAFAYYRRVIEGQKNRILDEIIKAAEKLNATPELIKELTYAKNETQFTKALEGVRSSLPDQLQISGENPLLLLHDALSEGLHKETDEECLKKAGDIRVIMAELAERLSQVLKEDSELKAVVSRLQRLRQQRASGSKPNLAESENQSSGS